MINSFARSPLSPVINYPSHDEHRYILYCAERLWLALMLCSMVQLIILGGALYALADTSTQISLALASAALVSVPYVLLPGLPKTSKLIWILCVAIHAIR